MAPIARQIATAPATLDKTRKRIISSSLFSNSYQRVTDALPVCRSDVDCTDKEGKLSPFSNVFVTLLSQDSRNAGRCLNAVEKVKGMPQSSDEVIRQARERRQQQVAECARRAAKKILAKLKGGRPKEATLAELIAGQFEELTR